MRTINKITPLFQLRNATRYGASSCSPHNHLSVGLTDSVLFRLFYTFSNRLLFIASKRKVVQGDGISTPFTPLARMAPRYDR